MRFIRCGPCTEGNHSECLIGFTMNEDARKRGRDKDRAYRPTDKLPYPWRCKCWECFTCENCQSRVTRLVNGRCMECEGIAVL